MAIPRITVLTSGRGSNLRALLTAEHAGTLSGTITAVIANRPGIPALAIAAAHGAAQNVKTTPAKKVRSPEPLLT